MTWTETSKRAEPKEFTSHRFTQMASAVGRVQSRSWHRRTRRFASTGRPCLPGELRRPPFRKRACSTEPCLPANVRLRLCAQVPVLGSRFFLWYGEGSPLCSPSRQIKAEEGDAFQAGLDKRSLPTAALGEAVAKARRSRGSGGGVTNTSRPTLPRQHLCESVCISGSIGPFRLVGGD
jgi:hypothetical protein